MLSSSLKSGRRRTALASASIAALAGLAASSATAAETDEAIVGEVVVTAQKRAESLQDVPIAISAFSGDQLAAAGVDGSAELEKVTPGLVMSESGRDGQIFIRGVGSTRLSGAGADPSSSVYIDGVYRSRGSAALLQLLDVERVEVLRGPQGTLYGRNSTGGAIRYISKSPEPTFGGEITGGLGDYDLRRASARVDIPLIADRLLVRGSVLRVKRDGYMKNLERPGETFGRQNLTAGRLTVLFTPNETLSVTLHAGASKDDSDQTALKHYIDPLGPFRNAEIIADPRKVRADYGPRKAPVKTSYVDATVAWDLGFATLTSISGYNSLDAGPYQGDLDVTEIAGVTDGRDGLPNGIADGGKTYTQEFNLTSKGASSLEWVLGAFYLHDDNYTVRQGLYVPLIPALAANHTTYNAFGDTDAYAAFVSGSYQVTPQLRLNAGLRYSRETKSIDRGRYLNFVLQGATHHDRKTWDSWTPRIGVDFTLNDDAMLYASFSKGFKSGAFNASSFDPAVNPEKIDAYEAGAKTRWFDRRLTLNLAAFYYDYKDLQVQGLDPNRIGVEIISNAAGAEIKGAELEANWRVTSRFQLDGSLTWLNAEYTDFPTLAGNLKGNKLPNAPTHTASLRAEYTIPLGEAGDLRLNGDAYFSARRYLSETNNRQNASQPAYSLYNARATFTPASGNWDVSIYGKNLSDELVFSRTVTQAALLRTGFLAYLEPPRTWGAEVRFRF